MNVGSAHKPNPEVFTWQPVIDGLVRDIPMNVLAHPEALESGETQLHFYGGLGEERLSTARAVKQLGKLGLPSVGIVLPFHLLPATPANIERTIVEAPQAIAQHYNLRAENPGDKPIDLFGHSQGGGVVLMTASRAPEAYAAIAAWSPVGLTPDAFGDDPVEKRKEFLKRLVIQNNLKPEQNPLLHPSILRATYEAGRRGINDWRAKDRVSGRRLYSKLDYALEMDITDEVTKVALDHDLAVFGSTGDPLFRISELRQALDHAGALELLREMPGSHTNVASGSSDEQMGHVADWIKDARAKRAA